MHLYIYIYDENEGRKSFLVKGKKLLSCVKCMHYLENMRSASYLIVKFSCWTYSKMPKNVCSHLDQLSQAYKASSSFSF